MNILCKETQNTKARLLTLALGLSATLLSTTSLSQELLVVQERSKGVTMSGDSKLSKQEQVNVAAKGRIWAVKEGR